MKLKNQVAIVTGAGRGIGKAIALTYAREGADVVAACLTKTAIRERSEENPPPRDVKDTSGIPPPPPISVAPFFF